MTKMIKAISWCGIINYILKLKIKLFIWMYNDIMELFFGSIGESKTLLPLTWDSILKNNFGLTLLLDDQLTSHKPLNI
jgi:hypothetical protein